MGKQVKKNGGKAQKMVEKRKMKQETEMQEK